MERKKYMREFKLEAVNLVRERGVAIVQGPLNLVLIQNVWAGGRRSTMVIPSMRFLASANEA
jgi:hypothetical protein